MRFGKVVTTSAIASKIGEIFEGLGNEESAGVIALLLSKKLVWHPELRPGLLFLTRMVTFLL